MVFTGFGTNVCIKMVSLFTLQNKIIWFVIIVTALVTICKLQAQLQVIQCTAKGKTCLMKMENKSPVQKIVYIPMNVFHACEKQILHISCRETIVLPEKVSNDESLLSLIAVQLQDQLCSILLAEFESINVSNPIDDISVPLCWISPSSLPVWQQVMGVWVYSTHDRGENISFVDSSKSILETILKEELDVFVMERKSVAMNNFYRPRAPENDASRANDGNRGNMVWLHGATHMMAPTSTLIKPENYFTTNSVPPPDAFIMATANILLTNPKSSAHRKFQNKMETWVRTMDVLNVTTLMLGIGIQTDFGVEPRLLDYQVEFLKHLSSMQSIPAIGTRGSVTTSECVKAGVSNCISTGCPSLTISREINLGKKLEQGWLSVQTKLSKGDPVKIGMVPPAIGDSHKPYPIYKALEPIMRLFFALHTQADESLFICQSRYDSDTVNKFWQQFNIETQPNLIIFDNLEQWSDTLQGLDIVISTRIHGAMVGIASGIPVVVIPTDFRILELVHVLRLPHLPFEAVLKTNITSLDTILNDAHFTKFDLFEENRRSKLLQWKGILASAGLHMDPSLLQTLSSPA